MLRTSGTVAGMLLTAATAVAQVPGVPGVPAAPSAPAALPAAAPTALPAAPAKNIWSFFCLTPEQKAAHEAKKRKFCQSQAGRMLYGITKPLSLATGGLIGGCCPPDFGSDAAAAGAGADEKAGNDPAAAADKIKKLEAEAGERKAAVRYLATVDCKRFPEAEATLISALRTDTNECVRYEAALGLNRGCCCTKKTVEALTLTVAGDVKDGNPAETSPRVRSAAARALAKCCGAAADPADGGPAEPPLENPPSGKPLAELKAEGRRALDAYYASAAARPQLLPGEKSLMDAYRVADGPRLPPRAAVVPAPAAPPQAMPPLILTRSETPTPAAPGAAPATGTGTRSVWDIFQATAKPRPDR